MADEKIYYPETIQETPFPGDEQEYISGGNVNGSGGTYKPATTQDQPLPTKRVATELISTSLNTKSKKITGEYGFTKSGAIQVGEYKQAISGELKLSPDGIVARNKSGITTFAIDGDTGDAVFAGRLQSGSLVTGSVAVGDGNILIDGENRRMIFYDETTGLPVIVIGNVG